MRTSSGGRGTSLHHVLAAVPLHYGVVRAAWRNFVPRPDGHPFFAERMTARLCTPSFHPHPLSTHSKSAHRAVADVRIGRGNHEAFGTGLHPVRGWYPIEILHFPVRSLEHCMRKYVTQFVALERNAEKGIPGHMEEAYRAYRAGQLAEFYAPLVVSDEGSPAASRTARSRSTHALRDALRSLGFGEGAADARKQSRSRAQRCRRRPPTPASTPHCRSRTSASRSASVSTPSSGGSPRSSAGRRRAPARRSAEAWARDAGVAAAARLRPHPRRGDHALPARARGLLARGARADGQGRDTWDYLAYYLQSSTPTRRSPSCSSSARR